MAINSIRGILSLLILWHHLGPETTIPYEYHFGYVIVLFFFILSGFHMTLTWKERLYTVPFSTFMKKRCVKIFPIQWLMVFCLLAIGIEPAAWWAVPLQLSLTQSLVPLWQGYFSLHAASWFLSSLFVCYLCTYLLINLAVQHQKRFVLLLLCSMICFDIILQFLPDSIGHRWLVYINPFARIMDYSLGIVMAVCWMRVVNLANNFVVDVKKSLNCFYTLLELLFIILMTWILIDVPFAKGRFLDLRYPVVIGFIMVFSLSKGYISKMLSSRILVHLGTISLCIYMFHPIVLQFFPKMVGVMPEWIAIVSIYAVVIIGSQLLTRYYLPWGMKMFNRVVYHFRIKI